MAWRVDVRHRRRQAEIMDQPGLDVRRHHAALRGLERINLLSRSAGILWPSIDELARREAGRALKILDLATGAGDVPIALWRRARRAGIALEIDACDLSEQALEFARRRASRRGADIHFFVHDALAGPLPREYDVVVCSLFLHHLEGGDAVRVLQRMAAAAREMVLVNDLRRSWRGWWLAWFGTRLLTTSAVAQTDGPRSVEGAFTIAEVQELARQAGLEGATVKPRWPCRWLLEWRREKVVCHFQGGTP